MNLQQLEALADAVYSPFEDDWERQQAEKLLCAAANPATIKALVALCRLQHEAIHMLRLKTDMKYGIPIADEAIAAYERFNGGAE